MLFNTSTQSITSQPAVTYVPQHISHGLLIGENGVFSKHSQYSPDIHKHKDKRNNTEENGTTDGKPTISSSYEYDEEIALGEETATRYSESMTIKKIDMTYRTKSDSSPGQHRRKVIVDEQNDKKNAHLINLHVPRSPANHPHTRTYITHLIRSLTKFAPAATAFS